MSEVQEPTATAEETSAGSAESTKYTRNNPYYSSVVLNYLLTGKDSEKQTRHIAFALEEGMTYTPGDSIGVNPEHRAEAVAEVLAALGSTGDERVLDLSLIHI